MSQLFLHFICLLAYLLVSRELTNQNVVSRREPRTCSENMFREHVLRTCSYISQNHLLVYLLRVKRCNCSFVLHLENLVTFQRVSLFSLRLDMKPCVL